MSDLKVTIKNETGNQSTKTVTSSKPSTPQKAAEKLDPKNDSTNSTKKDNQGLAVASLVASKTFSYCTSNVGKWTGNSQNQAAVDFITRATGYAVAFASNVYVGIATVALDSATYAIDYTMELYWNKKQEAQAQARSGGKGGYRR